MKQVSHSCESHSIYLLAVSQDNYVLVVNAGESSHRVSIIIFPANITVEENTDIPGHESMKVLAVNFYFLLFDSFNLDRFHPLFYDRVSVHFFCVSRNR